MTTAYWLAFATANPPDFFSQEECFRMAGYDRYPPEAQKKFRALVASAEVSRRALCLRPGAVELSKDPNEFHRRYVEGVRAIAPAAASAALERAGIPARELDFLVFVSCTGFTVPGFAIELAASLGLGRDCPVANLLGMGCSALIPGLARGSDFVRAHPGSRALVIAAEICSATYWVDEEIETAVGNALFGDGAAAVVLSSSVDDVSKPREGAVGEIEGFKTLRESRFLGDMGFTQQDGRLRVRLDRDIPVNIAPLVKEALSRLELPPNARVAIHPGGPKILDSLGADLPDAQVLEWSRHVLKRFGNMSSPTVAFVLERSFRERPLVAEGEAGALLTMGPGFSVESMRVRWRPPVFDRVQGAP